MHPLTYKQQRQFINALRRILRNPRQLLAFLVVFTYGGLSLGMIAAMVVLPFPAELRDFLAWFGITGELEERLQSFRGALTVTLVMIASLAAFQNPLLRFAPADIDILFATPVPLRRVMLSRLLLNHLRTLLAGYFFWGLAVVPVLRLLGHDPWPPGVWGLLGLMLLFSSVDQGFAAAQLGLSARDAAAPAVPTGDTPSAPPGALRFIQRVVLLLAGAIGALLLLGLAARLVSGTWALLGLFLQSAGGPLASSLLLPLGLVTDLLLLPTGNNAPIVLALAGLLLLDAAMALLLLRQVQRAGAGVLLSTTLTPGGQPSRLDELLWEVGFNPLRFFRVLWQGEMDEQWETAGTTSRLPCFGHRAGVHLWRRLAELRRTPLQNLLAVTILGLVPLAFYDPTEGYSLSRLLTAIIFSTSLGTQFFNDAADHLRYANLELSAPVARWRLLLNAHLPRLALYWSGGLLLLLGAGLLSPGANWGDLGALALWYPMVLVPLLALRGALVFVYPAAGLPGQRDPVQAMLVTLINGLLVLFVIMLLLLPFGVLIMLMNFMPINRLLFWPVIYGCTLLICAACCALLLWSYQRYEPGE